MQETHEIEKTIDRSQKKRARAITLVILPAVVSQSFLLMA